MDLHRYTYLLEPQDVLGLSYIFPALVLELQISPSRNLLENGVRNKDPGVGGLIATHYYYFSAH
jgi:hypothetical protein